VPASPEGAMFSARGLSTADPRPGRHRPRGARLSSRWSRG
jgi:hypothetical protein